MQPWTYTSVFTDEHGHFVFMCVKFNYLTMDYTPYTLRVSPSLDFFFLHACL